MSPCVQILVGVEISKACHYLKNIWLMKNSVTSKEAEKVFGLVQLLMQTVLWLSRLHNRFQALFNKIICTTFISFFTFIPILRHEFILVNYSYDQRMSKMVNDDFLDFCCSFKLNNKKANISFALQGFCTCYGYTTSIKLTMAMKPI